MDLKLNGSCLQHSEYDIVVDGRRYGILVKIKGYDFMARCPTERWGATMGLPEWIDNLHPWTKVHFTADTMIEAVRMAFEDFASSGSMTDDEFAQIAMKLFATREATEDILAAI